MICIINYDTGNVGAVHNMLHVLGFESTLTNNPDEIEKASHLILPGVGAFDHGMKKLIDLGIIPVLEKKVLQQKTPILGICLGAQLMCKGSEEGQQAGLGWIDAKVKRFPLSVDGNKLVSPNIGWNEVIPKKPEILFNELEMPRFYFVHSYFIECENRENVLCESEHGIKFDSAFQKGCIFGVQFHPEKSHRFGKQLLKNFIMKDGAA